jgi:hypothetical protein
VKPSIIAGELRIHAPFTAFGTVTGIIIMASMIQFHVPREVSNAFFWFFHPLHVLLSALVTTSMYRIHTTLSDSLMPFVGEWLLDLPNRGLHLGFIEKWWLVNPLAFAGIALGHIVSHTKISHAGHVLISTWASILHITMALGASVDVVTAILIAVFLFLAVWVPCCTSDIIFPLLWVKKEKAL